MCIYNTDTCIVYIKIHIHSLICARSNQGAIHHAGSCRHRSIFFWLWWSLQLFPSAKVAFPKRRAFDHWTRAVAARDRQEGPLAWWDRGVLGTFDSIFWCVAVGVRDSAKLQHWSSKWTVIMETSAQVQCDHLRSRPSHSRSTFYMILHNIWYYHACLGISSHES